MIDHTIHDGFQISGLYTTPTLKKVDIEAMMMADCLCQCGVLAGFGRGGGNEPANANGT